jgi:hypothetical protein
MSVPASIATAVTGVAAIANPMDILMASINTNPYFIGVMMLLLNLGGRFLSLEITKEQEKVLSKPAVRRFFLFAVLFVATRNMVVALGLTVIVVLILGYLFNENSDLCLWKSCTVGKASDSEPQASYSGLTAEEVMILKRLQDKQMAAQKKDTQTPEVVTPFVNASQVYMNAINTLRGTF